MARRGRLLIPLFLMVAVVCCDWSVAHARLSERYVSGSTTYVGSAKPGMRPFSGEPDTGQNKLPPTKAVLVSTPAAGGHQALSVVDRLLWIGRIWIARYLGTS